MEPLSMAFILKLMRESNMPVILIPESILEKEDDSDDIDEENYVLEGLKKRDKKYKQSIQVIPNVL
jgi:hypothetical protein